MAVAVKDESKNPFLNIEDEEDALLNEAICCSRNLEAQSNDIETLEEAKRKLSSPLWCDMDVDSSTSDLSGHIRSGNQSSNSSSVDQSLNEGIDEEKLSIEKTIENKKVKEELIEDIKQEKIEPFVLENVKNESDCLAKVDTIEKDINTVNKITPNVSDRKRAHEDQGEEEYDKDENSAKISRSRKHSSSTSSSGSSKKTVEYETDPAVLARRQKDIDYGKNTIGYDRYVQLVRKDQRTKEHPRTPPLYMKYSRRGWDGMVKIWRKQLHFYDPVEDGSENDNKRIKIDPKSTDDDKANGT